MKIQATRRPSGFTLVELLVVIAIIAVLAAAGFAAGNAAIQKAKRVTALSTATALESAVNNFFSEYGTMPVANLSGDVTIDTKDKSLLKELLGLGNNLEINTRSIKFLSVKEHKGKKGGIEYSGNGSDVTAVWDPWGGPFFLQIDGDYDEKVETKTSASQNRKVLNGRRVAAWSNGADAAPSGTGGKPGDDVITW